jgi:mono/diheme cytochrome c family protein
MKSVVACVYLAAFILVVFSASRANGQQSDNRVSNPGAKAESIYAEISKTPEKARARRNPLEKDPQAPAAGRILFEQHCAECHGDAAEGGKKGPSLKVPEIQNAAPGAIFWILTNGVVRKSMPVWSKLPEPQRWQLVAYIKSLGVAPASPEPSSSAPPKPHAS